MEKTDRAAVVPLSAGWSDVGSFAALQDALPPDASGNVTRGDVVRRGREATASCIRPIAWSPRWVSTDTS